MTPERKRAILFFFATLLVAIGILVWHFRLNRGVLAITGEIPFTVTIGKFKDAKCETNPCRFSLPPKKYRLRASKEGYVDSEIPVTVKRFREENITLEFQFRPVIQDAKEKSFPEKIPPALSGISLPAHVAIAFGDKEDSIFLIGRGAPQKVYKISALEPAKPVVITQFEKPLANAALYASTNGMKLLAGEILKNESKWYLIDVQAKTKKRFLLPPSISAIRFLNDDFFAAQGSDGVMLSSISGGEKEILPAINISSVSRWTDKSFIFISDTEIDSSTSTITFTEILARTEVSAKTEQNWFFYSYDLETGEKTLLANLPRSEEEIFGMMDEEVRDGKLLFSLEEGGKIHYYHLVLED